MGCGSSTASKGAVQEAAPVAPTVGSVDSSHSPHRNKPTKESDNVNPSPPPQPTNDRTSATDQPQLQETKKKKLVQLNSSVEGPPSTDAAKSTAASPALPCDLEGRHSSATIWCTNCEMNMCDECDASTHTDENVNHACTILSTGKPKKLSHLAGEGSEQRIGKFTVKSSNPAAPSDSESADSSAQPKFVVKLQPALESNDTSEKDEVQKSEDQHHLTRRHSHSKSHHRHHSRSHSRSHGEHHQHRHHHHHHDHHHSKKTLIHTLSRSRLSHLGFTEASALWDEYDKNGNGSLDRREMKSLAQDIVKRVVQAIKNDLHHQHPDYSSQQINELAEKEKWFHLPADASHEDGDDSERAMQKRVLRALDLNGDGHITKHEYMSNWNRFASQIFAVEAADPMETPCSIM